MTRLASMIVPLLSVLTLGIGAANAGEIYERTSSGKYKPANDSWYSSTCCYKKIVKHITIIKEVWVKVPPPKPHHQHAEEDDAANAPRLPPASHHAHQVIALGEIVQIGDKCRKAVAARERGISVIVMVNVGCR